MFDRTATTQELTEQFAGKRQGSYTILYAIRKNVAGKKSPYVYFVCQCDCGKKREVIANEFKRLHKCQSCCQITHNKSYTKLYKSYTCMKERCCYPHNNRYYKYGGRGIKICEEWLKDRTTFFNWALANGYKDGLTIDRIDVNGNYCPENCRWITKREQAKNKTTTRYLTYKGETKSLTEWAQKLHISPETITLRIKKNWPPKMIFSSKKFIKNKGEQ